MFRTRRKHGKAKPAKLRPGKRLGLAAVLLAAANLAVVGWGLLGLWRPVDLIPRNTRSPYESDGLAPAQLKEWRGYAAERQCSLDDDDYAQILDDLRPFRQQGGISQASVENAHRSLPSSLLLTVRNGSVDASLNGPAKGLPPMHWQDLVSAFASSLPDGLQLLFNLREQPRSWVAPLPAEAEKAMASGRETLAEVFKQHGCNAVGLDSVRERHGLLASPGMFKAQHALLPVLSASKVQGCFGDILAPGPEDNPEDLDSSSLVTRGNAKCPLNNATWESKRDVAFWRGSSSGANVEASTSPEQWKQYHRQRLVAMSSQYRDMLDAAFSTYVQCDPASCLDMKQYYGQAPRLDPEDFYQYKYLVLVDGNGAPMHLAPALCTGSAVMLPSILREWFRSRLVPYEHYIPVRPDYSDLPEMIAWARSHDTQVQRIVKAAGRLVDSRLREADAHCYMYRLLLEYAALYRPGAPSPPEATASRGATGAKTAAAVASPPRPP